MGSRRDRLTARHAVSVPNDWSRIRILRDGLDREAAKRWERFYIARFGRKCFGSGCLVNRRDGGEGQNLSPDACAQISEQIKALHLLGVFNGLNSAEAIAKRRYARMANRAASAGIPEADYAALPRHMRCAVVRWLAEHPGASWEDWLAQERERMQPAARWSNLKAARDARAINLALEAEKRYGVSSDEWMALSAQERNALRMWSINNPEGDVSGYLKGFRRKKGPAPRFAKNVVFAMHAEGLAQAEIARRLGCHQCQISRIINGRRQAA